LLARPSHHPAATTEATPSLALLARMRIEEENKVVPADGELLE